jgi:hypothetical protein
MNTKVFDHAMYARKVKKMTLSELEFVIKDCKEVLSIWPDHPNYSYYTDEILYCLDEINRRNKK